MRALLFAFLLAAPALAAAQSPRTVEVRLSSFDFTPNEIRLRAGEPVTLHLVNNGRGGHNFSAPQFFAAASGVSGPVRARRGRRRRPRQRRRPADAGARPLSAALHPHPPHRLRHDRRDRRRMKRTARATRLALAAAGLLLAAAGIAGLDGIVVRALPPGGLEARWLDYFVSGADWVSGKEISNFLLGPVLILIGLALNLRGKRRLLSGGWLYVGATQFAATCLGDFSKPLFGACARSRRCTAAPGTTNGSWARITAPSRRATPLSISACSSRSLWPRPAGGCRCSPCRC